MAEEKDSLPPEVQAELVKELLKQRQSRVVVDTRQRIKELQELRATLERRDELKPGDIVKWKPNLRNRAKPDYNEPAIVVEVLSKPRHDPQKDAGTPYFGEPLDILLGIIDEDNDFVVYHFDRRRFELFERAVGKRGRDKKRVAEE